MVGNEVQEQAASEAPWHPDRDAKGIERERCGEGNLFTAIGRFGRAAS